MARKRSGSFEYLAQLSRTGPPRVTYGAGRPRAAIVFWPAIKLVGMKSSRCRRLVVRSSFSRHSPPADLRPAWRPIKFPRARLIDFLRPQRRRRRRAQKAASTRRAEFKFICRPFAARRNETGRPTTVASNFGPAGCRLGRVKLVNFNYRPGRAPICKVCFRPRGTNPNCSGKAICEKPCFVSVGVGRVGREATRRQPDAHQRARSREAASLPWPT